jgi:ABC-type lipoprotein export system ATPase subunit/pSer/pThr/pTyr-binding forkhead associated (FHA) protein
MSSGESKNFKSTPLRQMMLFDVVEGPRTGEKISVPMPEPGEPPVLIGRSRECQIWIDAQNISRRNTEILSGPDRRPVIRDMGSVNGTLVNGQSISQTTPLPMHKGDRIRVGLTELIFQDLSVLDVPAPITPPLPYPVQPFPGSSRISTPGLASPSTVTFSAGPRPPATSPRPISGPLSPHTTPLTGDYFVYLVVRGGERYLFENEEATVGRGQANDIVIDSNSISRQHARFQKTVAGVFVTDLGSTNKTFVNGVQADGPVLLRNGDVIRFGDVETDFLLEPQRLTSLNRLVPRPDPNDPNDADKTFISMGFQTTEREPPSGEQSFVARAAESTFISSGALKYPGNADPKRNLDQAETALELDVSQVRVVGRNLRQASQVIPSSPGPGPGTPPLDRRASQPLSGEVARLEEVFLTEGTGRATELLLNNLRLGLKPGEMVALVGPSGSGKTELLQVLGGLRAADKGRVTVLGRPLPTAESSGGNRPNLENDRELGRWRTRSIGYLPREADLNPRLTVLEQLIFVLEQGGFGRDPLERMEKATAQLDFVGMADPEILRLRPAELNRTERKLVALARSLALDPPLLLTDEPTGRVPSAAAERIFNLLKRVAAKNQSVFMVTSDQLWARNADRQIEIIDGSIVGSLA